MPVTLDGPPHSRAYPAYVQGMAPGLNR
jgi:hypothetical protein